MTDAPECSGSQGPACMGFGRQDQVRLGEAAVGVIALDGNASDRRTAEFRGRAWQLRRRERCDGPFCISEERQP